MEDIADQVKELLKKLVAIDSTPIKGNIACARFLEDWLVDLGFQVTRQEVMHEFIAQANVIAKLGNPQAHHMAFLNHLDTVSAGDMHSWTKTDADPFKAKVEDDLIYGLGVSDAKGVLAARMLALKLLVQDGWKGHCCFVGTFGEEMGLQGVRLITQNVLPTQYVLVGEPSNQLFVRANKGYMIYEARAFGNTSTKKRRKKLYKLRFSGKSAHTSTPHLGDNAIVKALNALNVIQAQDARLAVYKIVGGLSHNIVPHQCEVLIETAMVPDEIACDGFEVVKDENMQPMEQALVSWMKETVNQLLKETEDLKENYDRAFDPPYTSMSIGHINADAHEVYLLWDARSLPNMPTPVMHQRFMDLHNRCQTQCLNSHFAQKRSVNAFEIKNDDFWLNRLRQIDKKESDVKSGCTEASVLQEEGFFPVVHGPGTASGNIHKPNESCSMQELTEAVLFYKKLLEAYGGENGVKI